MAKRKGTFRACCHAIHHRGQSGTAMSGGEMAVFPVSGRESIKEALPHPTGAHTHSRACCLLVPEDPGSNRGPDTDSQPAHLALTQFGCWWCPPRRTVLFLSSVREGRGGLTRSAPPFPGCSVLWLSVCLGRKLRKHTRVTRAGCSASPPAQPHLRPCSHMILVAASWPQV